MSANELKPLSCSIAIKINLILTEQCIRLVSQGHSPYPCLLRNFSILPASKFVKVIDNAHDQAIGLIFVWKRYLQLKLITIWLDYGPEILCFLSSGNKLYIMLFELF